MSALSTATSLVVESVSYQGVGGFVIFAMMAGVATLAELDRYRIHTSIFCWTIVPILWGGFVLAESGSLLLAATGVATLWFFPGLGFLLAILTVATLAVGTFHRLFTTPETE